MARRYLRRTADDVVDRRRNQEPWATPSEWQDLIDAGSHTLESGPGGVDKDDIGQTDANGYSWWNWKIAGGAWVATSQAERDAEMLAASRTRRMGELGLLKACRDAQGALALDMTLSEDVRTAAAVYRDACQAGIEAHDAGYGDLWVEGSNP